MINRRSDPSLVSYRHGVGYRRSPGNLTSLVTRSIGWSRMSLWSAVATIPRGVMAWKNGYSHPRADLHRHSGRWEPCVLLPILPSYPCHTAASGPQLARSALHTRHSNIARTLSGLA
jgi:hypothetical protein